MPTFVRFLRACPSRALVISLGGRKKRLQSCTSLLSISLDDPRCRDCFIVSFHPRLALGSYHKGVLFLRESRTVSGCPKTTYMN